MKNNIRLKILTPLVFMLVVSGTFFTLGFSNIQKENLRAEIENKTHEVDKLFSRLLDKEAKFMAAQLQFIANDPELLRAWQSRNRKELFEKADTIFKKINADFGVTHFYFTEPDKTCFLRVHSPDNFGDKITRFTTEKAVTSARVISGIELGPLGTFTLRVVSPWIHEGQLLGYLELGEEIEHLIPRLQEISGLDLVFLIDKKNLLKENWQNRGQGLNKTGDWDEFTDFVVIDSTLSTLPFKLEDVAGQNISQDFKFNDRRYSVYSHSLHDVSGKKVGTMIVIYEITAKVAEGRKKMVFPALAITIVFLLILLFYFRYSGVLEQTIYAYQNNLEDIIRERTRELHIALDEVKILSGYLPICASCKQIRDDKGYWTQIESYIRENSEAEFSHGICPECAKKLYPEIDIS